MDFQGQKPKISWLISQNKPSQTHTMSYSNPTIYKKQVFDVNQGTRHNNIPRDKYHIDLGSVWLNELELEGFEIIRMEI